MSTTKLMAILAIGPVSGPLLFYAYHCARKRQWWRVAASLSLLGAFYVLAPALLVRLLV